jgi:hypothetical protein
VSYIPKRFSHRVGVLLVFFLFASNANASISEIARDVTSPLPANITIAIQPINRVVANMSASRSTGLIEQLTNEVQRSIQNTSSTLVDRGQIDTIMMEQEEFQDVEEFSELIANTGADALISLTLMRRNQNQVEVSARAFGVKGSNSGKVLSASKTYVMEIPAVYTVAISSIKQGGLDRSKYLGSFLDGMLLYSGLEVAPTNLPRHQIDYDVSISIDFNTESRATTESKEAKKQAEGLAMFNSLVSSMGSASSGNVFGNMGQSMPDEGSLKQTVYISEVEARYVKLGSNAELYASAAAETSSASDASNSEMKTKAVASIKEALRNLGAAVGVKITGEKTASSSSASLLD